MPVLWSVLRLTLSHWRASSLFFLVLELQIKLVWLAKHAIRVQNEDLRLLKILFALFFIWVELLAGRAVGCATCIGCMGILQAGFEHVVTFSGIAIGTHDNAKIINESLSFTYPPNFGIESSTDSGLLPSQ